MGKFFKIFILILCCLGLWGCTDRTPEASPLLVSQVHVLARHQGDTAVFQYTHPKKMETILYYLRTLEDQGLAKTDPERIMGDSYRIYLTFSDGSRRVYYQQADRFLSKNAHPWHRINSTKASLLYPLLKSMPSDQI